MIRLDDVDIMQLWNEHAREKGKKKKKIDDRFSKNGNKRHLRLR